MDTFHELTLYGQKLTDQQIKSICDYQNKRPYNNCNVTCDCFLGYVNDDGKTPIEHPLSRFGKHCEDCDETILFEKYEIKEFHEFPLTEKVAVISLVPYPEYWDPGEEEGYFIGAMISSGSSRWHAGDGGSFTYDLPSKRAIKAYLTKLSIPHNLEVHEITNSAII